MTSRTRVRLCAAIAAACLVALVGCDGTPTPSPSPTATVNPTPPETSLERQQREDFEAAEKAYRTFIAETDRIAMAGGTMDATPIDEADGSWASTSPFNSGYSGNKKQAGEKSYQPARSIGYVRPGGYTPTQVTLDVCEDGSTNKVTRSHGKQVSQGQMLLRSLYVRKIGGHVEGVEWRRKRDRVIMRMRSAWCCRARPCCDRRYGASLLAPT